MRSLPFTSISYLIYRPNLSRSLKPAPCLSVYRLPFDSGSHCSCKFNAASFQRHGCIISKTIFSVEAFDGDSFDYSSSDILGGNEMMGYTISSSEGEESDGEFARNLVAETTAQRVGRISRGRKRHRIRYGMFMNFGLIAFLTVLLLFMDCFAWKLARLPLPSFYLCRPFFTSVALVTFAGYIFVPLLNRLKIHQLVRTTGPAGHYQRRTIPTMGGLFFIPIGIAVANAITRFSSMEVSGAAAATLASALIGLVDDSLSLLNNDTVCLSAKRRTFLEAAVGTCFALWMDTSSISSPYGMKMLVPLPAPLGLVCLRKFYMLVTSFCFVFMGNGVNLTDGLDGLAGGVAALAFITMSITVLPICSDLSIFGASMAGACVGFLLHNRYRASVFMGFTGSLALGGALAAMAACTGMFFPLFIASGVFILEAASVMIQVAYYKTTKCLKGTGRRFFKIAPFHHHLELCGLKQPVIIAMAYILSSILSLSAAYIGLMSI